MVNDELEEWVASLAGKKKGKHKEAELLGELIRMEAQQHQAGETNDQAESERHLIAIKSHLRAKGVFNKTRWWQRWMPTERPLLQPIIIAATMVLIIAVGLQVLLPVGQELYPQRSDNLYEAPRFRGAGTETLVCKECSTKWLAGVIEQLGELKLPYELKQEEPLWILRFYVADTSKPRASDWLSREAIEVPPSGWVEIKVNKDL